MGRVSIKDIARVAEVSHSTVSRALSDSPLVSAETRLRISNLARQMGYSPDAQARSLAQGRTHTIGVVVTTITDPFIAEVVQAIEDTAYDQGYTVVLASSGALPEREIAAVEILHSKRVDAVIVTSSRVGSLYHEHLARLEVPVVLVNSHNELAGRYTFSISVDNRHGGRLAAEHLTHLGHRHIAYITGPANHSDDQDRLAGYRQALAGAGIASGLELVVPGTGRCEGGEAALPTLVSARPRPTAVFCYNDMTAVGLLRAARHAGLSIPGDLAVVGFDDIPLASLVTPSLTTIAQPMRDMGRQAVQMVLALAGSKARESKRAPGEETSAEGGIGAAAGCASDIVVQGGLIVRESSGG